MNTMELKEQARAIVSKARHAGRDLTDEEQQQVDGLLVKIKSAEASEREHRGRELEAALSSGTRGVVQRQPHPWTKAITEHAQKLGFKDLSGNGHLDVPSLQDTIISSTGDQGPASVLNLMPVEPLDGTSRFAFLRETTRDMQAAPVEIGAEKPTTTLQLTMVEETAQTVAHLSEPIPRQYLADVADLDRFIRDELSAGLIQAVEDQVLTGDGTSPNLNGLLPQIPDAADGDFIVAMRMAIADLAHDGIVPTAVVMAVEDAAHVDLLADQVGRYFGAGPFGAGPLTVWGVPRVDTAALEAGTAIIGDFRTGCALRERQGVTVDWSDAAGDGWSHNTVRFRCEMRVGLALYKPFAFRKLDSSQIGPAVGGQGGGGATPTSQTHQPATTHRTP